MLKTWANLNIDMDAATRLIVDFFEKRNFGVHVRRSGKTVVISTFDSIGKTSFVVHVRSDDGFFEIEFAPKESVSLRRYENLFSAFGGGHFILRRLRSEEALEKIESEFWSYISETIAEMGGVKA